MRSRIVLSAAALVLVGTAGVGYAQPGAHSTVDGRLGILGSSLAYQGRSGAYPNGWVGMSMATTSCNPGTANLPWFALGDLRHPIIAFLAARVNPGASRIVQVSNRSWVKHGFFALSNSQCTPCQCPSGGSYLGVGCSDTYSTGNNASSLGPPDNLNPWTGVWSPTGTSAGNVVFMLDQDLIVAGASYYYCAQYVFSSWTQFSVGATTPCGSGSPLPQPPSVPTGLLNEPDANRTNSFASRPMSVTYNVATGSATFSTIGTQLDGTVLQRWTGATLDSDTNGDPATGPSDGRVYVAVKVTGPTNGLYHYEYAGHNRDNAGGIGAFRLPICAGAVVTNVGFHDIDVPLNAANDWAFSNTGSEIRWTAPGGNSLRWNSIYNFWFDSDAAPVAGDVTLDQATMIGGVAPNFTVRTTVPGILPNVNLGPGCGTPSAPSLYATGSPAQATLGNATFGLQSAGNAAGATCVLLASAIPGTTPIGACNVYMSLAGIFAFPTAVANGSGVASWATPVPNDGALQGSDLNFQEFELQAGGALLGLGDLSNGLKVRIGNGLPNCP